MSSGWALAFEAKVILCPKFKHMTRRDMLFEMETINLFFGCPKFTGGRLDSVRDLIFLRSSLRQKAQYPKGRQA